MLVEQLLALMLGFQDISSIFEIAQMVCCEGTQPSSHLNLTVYLVCFLSLSLISYDKSSYSFDMSCSDTQVPCARGNAVSVSSSISFCTIFHVITSLLGAWMECGAVAFWEKTWHKAAMHPNRCFCIGNTSVKACRSMLSQDETKPNNQHGVSHKTYTASVLRISKISKISSDLVITLTCPFHPLSLVRLESEACHRG